MKTNNISRRDFLKISGAGAATFGLASCTKKVKKITSTPEVEETHGTMPMRSLNGKENISLLGYGCMRWPMTKDKDGKNIVDQEKVDELIDYAIAHGINYFDNAPIYLQGQSEEATGKSLARYPRESYYIATKLSNQHSPVQSYDEGVTMYQNSRKYFRTDYIDFFLLHDIPGGEKFTHRFIENGLLDYFLKEREEGRIHYLGFSFHGDTKGFDEMMVIHDKYHFDFVQIQMNYVDWNHAAPGNANAEYLYTELSKREIPVIVMEPLLGGQLSNVPNQIASDFKTREPEKSIASWAFRFVASHPGILTTLSGMTYMEHLQDNLETFTNFKPLNDDEYDMLEKSANIIRNYPLINCTGCRYCMPCPYGIDIPTIFKHYNKSVNESNIAESAEQQNYKELKKAYLVSYDKAVESVRQADHCIGCGQCAQKCPQHINIPQKLQSIDKYVESLKRNTL